MGERGGGFLRDSLSLSNGERSRPGLTTPACNYQPPPLSKDGGVPFRAVHFHFQFTMLDLESARLGLGLRFDNYF